MQAAIAVGRTEARRTTYVRLDLRQRFGARFMAFADLLEGRVRQPSQVLGDDAGRLVEAKLGEGFRVVSRGSDLVPRRSAPLAFGVAISISPSIRRASTLTTWPASPPPPPGSAA